jgi:hypothetical protein
MNPHPSIMRPQMGKIGGSMGVHQPPSNLPPLRGCEKIFQILSVLFDVL